MKRIYLEINTVPGYTKGEVISVLAAGSIPAEKFWRDRLKDAKIDDCVKIVKDPSSIKNQSSVKNSSSEKDQSSIKNQSTSRGKN